MDYVKETLTAWPKIGHQFVEIDEPKLLSIAAKKAVANKLHLPHWSDKGVLPQNAAAFASHVFFHNVVNFCYTDPGGKEKETFTVEYGRRTFKGAMAMAVCFYRAFGEKKLTAKDIWRNIRTEEAFRRFFEGKNRIPLIKERRTLLTESLEVLNAFFDGDPLHVFEAGGFRAFGNNGRPGIVDLLVKHFPLAFGRDTAELDGRRFYFFKRPQLLVLEYHGRVSYKGDGMRPIEDIERLGAICDYELPKSYIADGIFQVRGDLLARIRNRQPLLDGSREEIEMRGATYYAIIKEVEAINLIRTKVGLPPVHVGHLDYQRWTRGQKIPEPHMLVETTNY